MATFTAEIALLEKAIEQENLLPAPATTPQTAIRLPWVKRSEAEALKTEIEALKAEISLRDERILDLKSEIEEERESRQKTQEEFDKIIELLERSDGQVVRKVVETETIYSAIRSFPGMAMGGGGREMASPYREAVTTTSLMVGDVTVRSHKRCDQRVWLTSSGIPVAELPTFWANYRK